MQSFSEWLGQQPHPLKTVGPKKWKATKEEIIPLWKTLRPDVPIQVKPVPYGHKGSTYGEDGIRITGSREFIQTVIPRLKEFINFEGPTTKLNLMYRQTENKSQDVTQPIKPSYVFYIQVAQRGANG